MASYKYDKETFFFFGGGGGGGGGGDTFIQCVVVVFGVFNFFFACLPLHFWFYMIIKKTYTPFNAPKRISLVTFSH